MARLVVFDLDGTLVDSSRDIAASVNAALGRVAPGTAALPLEAILSLPEGTDVELREGQAPDSAVLRTLPKGTVLRVLEGDAKVSKVAIHEVLQGSDCAMPAAANEASATGGVIAEITAK